MTKKRKTHNKHAGSSLDDFLKPSVTCQRYFGRDVHPLIRPLLFPSGIGTRKFTENRRVVCRATLVRAPRLSAQPETPRGQ